MTEQNEDVPTREELEEIEHLAQAMAYQAGDLNPTERAAFEAHLPTCKICPPAMAASGEHWKQLSQLEAPTFTPKYTVEEQVQRFDAMVKEERRTKQARNEPWVARYWGRLVLAGAAVAAVFLVMRTPPTPSAGPQHMYAPVDDNVPIAHHAVDGGDAG